MDYKMAAKTARAEYIEKRSKFIATAKPVETEAEAEEFINSVKTEFYDARHNVSAFIINGGPEKYSDDGEPQGTAGIPALEVMRKRGLVNTAVVVTRYFGGILLGASGLVRAYTHSAALSLDKAGERFMRLCDILRLSCGYDFYAQADGLCREFGGVLNNRVFNEKVSLEILMPENDTDAFLKALTEKSNGKVGAQKDGKTYIDGDKLP